MRKPLLHCVLYYNSRYQHQHYYTIALAITAAPIVVIVAPHCPRHHRCCGHCHRTTLFVIIVDTSALVMVVVVDRCSSVQHK